MRISTKAHGVVDYATAGMLLAAPAVIPAHRTRSRLLLRGAGAGILGTSLVTNYELGVRRRIPMPVHLALDAATGAVLLAAPFVGGGLLLGDELLHGIARAERFGVRAAFIHPFGALHLRLGEGGRRHGRSRGLDRWSRDPRG